MMRASKRKKIGVIGILAVGVLFLILQNRNDNHGEVAMDAPEPVAVERSVETPPVRCLDMTVVDTLMAGDAVFISEPLPPEVLERMKGVSLPQEAEVEVSDLRYLTLPYYDFEGRVCQGEMVCNVKIAHDLMAVFRDLFVQRYQFCSIRLVDDFGGSDDASMRANNTSCFNYRRKSGGYALSAHALGLAVDVNPLQNPYVKRGKAYPENAADFADRSLDFAHKIDRQDACYKAFVRHGFHWGGSWQGAKDYQHFEKGGEATF